MSHVSLRRIWQSSRLAYSVMAATVIVIGLLILWQFNLLAYARLQLNDNYFTPAPTSDNIVIIAMDEDSLRRYGSSPAEWSRSIYADLIRQLIPANPRVLAFDLLFSEIEEDDEEFAEGLIALGQNEARTRIVLGTAGINNVSARANNTSDTAYFTFADISPTSPILEDASDYLGFTNTLPDIDSVVRRQASLVQTNTSVGYSFSVATYLAYLRIPGIAAGQVVTSAESSLFVTDEREIPVDNFGFWTPYYYGEPATIQNSTYSIVSFIDVVDGEVDLSLFNDKVVLIGLANNTGLLDKYLVPSSSNGALMSGVEIQAHAIESLIQNNFPRPLSAPWQVLLIVLATFSASLLYAFPRWYFKIPVLLILAILWFVAASIIFSTTFSMISLFDLSLALTVPFIASLGIDINIERRERQQTEFLLGSVQHLAEQRLDLEQAAQFILDDIRQLVPEKSSKLYLSNPAQKNMLWEFSHKQQPDKTRTQISEQSYTVLMQSYKTNGVMTFPIEWQNQQQGLLVVEDGKKHDISGSTRHRIRELIKQLTPHIDNLLLHHEVERQKSILDAVIAESPASIAIVDNEGRIIQYNDDLATLLNTDIQSLIGQSFLNLVSQSAENEELSVQLQDGFKKQTTFSVNEIKIGDLVVNLDTAPLKNYGLWAIIISDITSIIELSELKTQMLRIAAHDLKNPLGRIMGFAELLEMQLVDLNERQARYLSFILKGSHEMLNIITDILNLERLRSGNLKMRPTEITKLIREVCSSHQPDVINKQQLLDIQLPETRIYVNADLGQLSQAVTNLVGNAIKYTPDEGQITVRLLTGDEHIRFEVEDTGYGIPEDAQTKLFTEFYRAKSDATSHISGTGLGLSLVKSVIEAHGGTINFKSEESTGSTFYFDLPTVEMEINYE